MTARRPLVLISGLPQELPSGDTLDALRGTWTPGLFFGSGNTGIAFTTQVGRYTKIDDRARVHGEIALSSKGSSTGSAAITGLPFIVATRAVVTLWVNGVSYTGMIQAIANQGLNSISLYSVSSAGVLSFIDDTNFSNTSNIVFDVQYEV